MKPWRRERHLYQYACSRCKKHNAQSFKKGRAKLLLCQTCRRTAPSENQMGMFEAPVIPSIVHIVDDQGLASQPTAEA